MNGLTYAAVWSSGNYTQTATYDFPPMFITAMIVLSKIGGNGTARAGILSYRRRLPSGADETINLAASGSGDSPTYMGDNNVTSITFEVWTADAFGYASIEFTFW